jgi:peptidyl-prolyl cis-trans isomerase C
MMVNWVKKRLKHVGLMLMGLSGAVMPLISLSAATDNPVAVYDGLTVGTNEFNYILKTAPQQIQRQAKMNISARYELLANTIVAKHILSKLQRPTTNDGADEYLAFKFQVLELAREFDRALFQKNLSLPDLEPLALERYRISKNEIATIPETRLLSHILLLCNESCDTAVKQEELKIIRERLLNGESFADLAAEFSQDPASRQRGGRLSRPISLSDTNVDETFRQTAFSLMEPGAISDIVRSRFGFHVMRLEEVNVARLYTFDEIKPALIEEIEKRYRQDAYQAYFLSMSPGDNLEIDYEALDTILGPIPETKSLSEEQ